MLDLDRLQAKMKEAEAAFDKASYFLSEMTRQRIAEVFRRDAVSVQEYDEAQQAHHAALAAKNVAAAVMERIRVEIKKSTLYAPFDGTVTHRFLDAGSMVSVNTPVLTLQQNSVLTMRVGVSQAAAESVAVGESIRLGALDIQAMIYAKLPVRGARTRDLILHFLDIPKVVAGDILEITIDSEVTQRGFWLPITALKEGQRGLWSVYVAKEEIAVNQDPQWVAERRTVLVHYTDAHYAYVSGAVDDGEVVIIHGAHTLLPGQAVRWGQKNSLLSLVRLR